MIHACTRCGQNVEDDISIRVASYRKLNLCQGREILGLRLAVGGEERPLLRSASIPLIFHIFHIVQVSLKLYCRPMVKYVANIHGDEAVSRELLLGLAQYLVWNYGSDHRVTRLLNNTEVK